MEATNVPGRLVENPIVRALRWQAAKSAVRVLGRFLAEGVKGDEFGRAFTSPPGAEFASLPRSQQNRLLDRGFRP